jgi:hypothetical protein
MQYQRSFDIASTADPGTGLSDDPGTGLSDDPGAGLSDDAGAGLSDDAGAGPSDDSGTTSLSASAVPVPAVQQSATPLTTPAAVPTTPISVSSSGTTSLSASAVPVPAVQQPATPLMTAVPAPPISESSSGTTSLSASAVPVPAVQQPATPLMTPAAVPAPPNSVTSSTASLSAAAVGGITAGGAFAVAFVALCAALLLFWRRPLKKAFQVVSLLGCSGGAQDHANFDKSRWSVKHLLSPVPFETTTSVQTSASAVDVPAPTVADNLQDRLQQSSLVLSEDFPAPTVTDTANAPRWDDRVMVVCRSAAARPVDYEIADFPSRIPGNAVGVGAHVPTVFTYRNDAFGRHAAVQRAALRPVVCVPGAVARHSRSASDAAAAGAARNGRALLRAPATSNELRTGARRRHRYAKSLLQRRVLDPSHPMWGTQSGSDTLAASVGLASVDID